jgi:hypothetical protein
MAEFLEILTHAEHFECEAVGVRHILVSGEEQMFARTSVSLVTRVPFDPRPPAPRREEHLRVDILTEPDKHASAGVRLPQCERTDHRIRHEHVVVHEDHGAAARAPQARVTHRTSTAVGRAADLASQFRAAPHRQRHTVLGGQLARTSRHHPGNSLKLTFSLGTSTAPANWDRVPCWTMCGPLRAWSLSATTRRRPARPGSCSRWVAVPSPWWISACAGPAKPTATAAASAWAR